MKKTICWILIMAMTICPLFSNIAYADEGEKNEYAIGELHEKSDSGYYGNKKIKSSDSHYGWELGQFIVSGYTRQIEDNNGNPIFLKNVGDKVAIKFELNQNIKKLNNDDTLSINSDDNGYDEHFGITKNDRTNFGKGTLLVKHTNYQNKTQDIAPYTDYLKGVEKGASTEIQFFEEGDYEIALDYEIRKNRVDFWKVHTLPKYSHYQILAKFSVRNGNCMVYPYDITTKSELVNTSFTEDGFYIDLAKSRYLDVNVKKMDYVENNNNLIEDTRFNKPASDGEKFTDEGIYVITVKNRYTNQETEKNIYVGSNPILKAYVTTGKDIDYIKELLESGAEIDDDGTIKLSDNKVIDSTEKNNEYFQEQAENYNVVTNNTQVKNQNKKISIKVIVIGILIVFAFIIIAITNRKPEKNKKEESDK